MKNEQQTYGYTYRMVLQWEDGSMDAVDIYEAANDTEAKSIAGVFCNIFYPDMIDRCRVLDANGDDIGPATKPQESKR